MVRPRRKKKEYVNKIGGIMNKTAISNPINEERMKCVGKIYLNEQNQVTFGCEICQEFFATFRHYINHVSIKHFNDYRVSKIDTYKVLEGINPIKEEDDESTNENCENQIPINNDSNKEESTTINVVRKHTNLKDSIIETYKVSEDINALKEEDDESFNENCENQIPINNNSDKEESTTINVVRKRTNLQDGKFNKDRKHICHYCNAAFAEKSYYYRHIKRHTGEKKISCAFCPSRFFTRSELNTHMRTHTGERPFVCQTCGRRFLTSGHLTSHMRRHTNEKPYKCKYCEKRFFVGTDMKDHMKTHLDERNYVCKICKSSFKKPGILRGHMKIHENKREYICNICDAAFNQRSALYSHKKTHGEKF